MPINSSNKGPGAVIRYWLGPPDLSPAALADQQKLWYYSTAETDQYIQAEFGADLAAAERGDLDHLRASAEGSLALVILLDQFSRNLYRGTSAAYSNDAQAQGIVLSLLERDGHLNFNIPARIVFYHPLHHAEDVDLQEKAVSLLEELLQSAPADWHEAVAGNLASIKNHCEIIRKFGRFPHRNTLMNRPSTPEERQYLEQDKRTYGQQ